MSKVIIHRRYDNMGGEHEDSEFCWCQPIALEPDDPKFENIDEMIALTEKPNA